MVNLKHYVEPTDVTFEWIIEQLDGDKRWDKTRKHHKVVKVEYQLVNETGFLSNVFHIVVHFSGAGHPFSAFLKGEQMAKGLIAYHNQEIRFYQLIGTRYNRFNIPKLYGFEHSDSVRGWHGRLLLSDVGQNACLANGIQGLSIAQCCSAIEAIAKLHAFTRYTADSEWILQSMGQNHLLDLADDQIQILRRLSALHEDYFVRNMPALRKLIETAHLQVGNAHLLFGIKPVLSHGDYSFKNILFKRDNHGRPSNKIASILDYQNCHVGTGINDLARFILTSTSAQVQQMCTSRFLKLYYETFQGELKKHGHEAGFCLDKMVQIYWFHYDHEFIFAISYLATEAMKAKDIYLREKTIQRMIAGFEPIREKYEK